MQNSREKLLARGNPRHKKAMAPALTSLHIDRRWTLWLLRGWLCGIVLNFAFVDNLALDRKALVVGVFDNLAHADITHPEMQGVIGARVSRKPILPINLLAVRYKRGRKVLLHVLVLLAVAGNGLRYSLAAGLHNLKIVALNPDPALEIPLALLDRLGRNIKNIRVDLVHVLLAGINQVVAGNLFRGHDECYLGPEILFIFPADRELAERRLRGKDHSLHPAAFVVVGDVAHRAILAGDREAVKFLDGNVLPERVVVAGLLEKRFFGGKFFDDLLLRGSLQSATREWA